MTDEPTPKDLDEDAFEPDSDTDDGEDEDGGRFDLGSFAGGGVIGAALMSQESAPGIGEIRDKTEVDEAVARIIRGVLKAVKGATGVSVDKAMGDGGDELPAVVDVLIGVGQKYMDARKDMHADDGADE